MQQNNAQFLLIPCVDNGEGKIRIYLCEHGGRTRSLFDGEGFTSKEFRHIERQFRVRAEELEALERHAEYTKSAREVAEYKEAWKRAAND